MTKFAAAGLHARAGLSAPGLPTARGRDAAAGVAGAGLRGVHGAEPDARPAARVPVVRPRRSRTSTSLTVGTPDANGQRRKSIGFARYDGAARQSRHSRGRGGRGRELSITDVRQRSDLEDYTGEVAGAARVPLTDRRQRHRARRRQRPGDDARRPVPGGGVVLPDGSIPTWARPARSRRRSTRSSPVRSRRASGRSGRWARSRRGRRIRRCGRDRPNTLFARQGVFVP